MQIWFWRFQQLLVGFFFGADGRHLDVGEINGFEGDTLQKIINLL